MFLLQNGRGVLVAPRTLALVCDQCAFLQYDPVALKQIEALLQSPVPSHRQRWSREPQPQVIMPVVREQSHEIQ